MRLLLVRHGESICGVNGIVGGARGCTGLTERGHAQARALAERLATEGIAVDVLLASTLPRAMQTAEAISTALGVDIVPTDGLREMVPGEADGGTWQDWREKYGYDVENELERPLSPGGESMSVFLARVKATLEAVLAEHEGRTVVACCHGGVIFGSLNALLGADPRVGAPASFTSITEWWHADRRWTLRRFNDVGHLAGTDLLAEEGWV